MALILIVYIWADSVPVVDELSPQAMDSKMMVYEVKNSEPPEIHGPFLLPGRGVTVHEYKNYNSERDCKQNKRDNTHYSDGRNYAHYSGDDHIQRYD